MEHLCDLLFELSSEGRMNIMNCLLKERLKLSHISQKLEMTVTEASRNLQRLSNHQLVSKEVDGTFSPTPYGELAVSLLSALDFISANRQYFLGHTASNIPYGFVNRLGELSSSNYEVDPIKLLAHCTEILQKAEEHIWVQSHLLFPDHVPVIEDRIKNGIDFRGILPEYFDSPITLWPVVRTRARIELRILATEKEAMAGFLHLTDKPEYSGFFSEDPKFIRWCKEVYQHYWENSKPKMINHEL